MTDTIERAVLDGVPWSWLAVDRHDRIVAIGSKCAALLGRSGEDLAPGVPLRHAVPPEFLPTLEERLRDSRGGAVHGGPITAIVHAGGSSRAVRLLVFAIGAGSDAAVGIAVEALPAVGDEDRPDAALDHCLAVVSRVRHEINNALMGIYGNAELLLGHRDVPEALRERAGALLEDARRIRDLVRELGTLRRRRDGE